MRLALVGGEPPAAVLVVVCVLGALAALSVARVGHHHRHRTRRFLDTLVGALALMGHRPRCTRASAGAGSSIPSTRRRIAGGWCWPISSSRSAGRSCRSPRREDVAGGYGGEKEKGLERISLRVEETFNARVLSMLTSPSTGRQGFVRAARASPPPGPARSIYPCVHLSWPRRRGRKASTSPEELIAAAHASCYAMALNATVGRQGGAIGKTHVTPATSPGRAR